MGNFPNLVQSRPQPGARYWLDLAAGNSGVSRIDFVMPIGAAQYKPFRAYPDPTNFTLTPERFLVKTISESALF